MDAVTWLLLALGMFVALWGSAVGSGWYALAGVGLLMLGAVLELIRPPYYDD